MGEAVLEILSPLVMAEDAASREPQERSDLWREARGSGSVAELRPSSLVQSEVQAHADPLKGADLDQARKGTQIQEVGDFDDVLR